MASLSNAAETAFLTLLFNNTAWANIGNAGGLQPSSVPGVFWVGLATADPGEAGTQATSEIVYTGYGRVSVARSGAGWTISSNNASNTAAITFGACTALSGTATFVTIGTDETGAGNLIVVAAITSPGGGLAISSGITPEIAIGALDINID